MKNILVALLILAATWFIMLPLGSFLLDAPLLIIIGFIIAFVCIRLLKAIAHPRASIWILSIITMALFYYASVSLYFSMPYVDWLHEFAALFPYISESPSGFHFMINSGILNIDYVNPEDAPYYLHLISGVIFASYILWLYLGVRLGRAVFGRRKHRPRKAI